MKVRHHMHLTAVYICFKKYIITTAAMNCKTDTNSFLCHAPVLTIHELSITKDTPRSLCYIIHMDLLSYIIQVQAVYSPLLMLHYNEMQLLFDKIIVIL
jgi:hypothetical protein